MLNKEYGVFKSGTDIRGVASEGVAGYEVNMTNERVERMANGFLLWLSNKVNKPVNELKVSVGRDSRISGERIANCVIPQMVNAGVQVIYTNLSSTPSMFMTTVDLGCDGAVQITASHHPFNRNGLKFFTRGGGLDGCDIEAILLHAQNNDKPEQVQGGTVTEVNYMKQYADNLCEFIRKEVNADDYMFPLKGFHIVVDAGNGVGGFYTTDVLEKLGAVTTGSKYLDPDGMFPNHIPNPEDPVAMKSICDAVIENNADLGVIFDTDVDRGGAVDRHGREINRNRLVALASVIALEGNDGGTIVTDSITSPGVKSFIEDTLGGKHYRYRRGYKNIINKAIELNEQGINCPIAAETSGHCALRDNYFLDDGAYLCTRFIIKAAQLRKEGKEIDDLVAELQEPVETIEIRYEILEPDFKACGLRVIDELTAYAEKTEGWIVADDNREGIRVSFGKEDGDGWFLLRLSVHDPIMPLNIESDSEGGVAIIREKVESFLKTTTGLKI
ncbi:MAG: phosphomannomutase/phosphoglucomutase [Ruminococcus sp.]|nr:phosphomannomutase/phosphoglucomutase [Ruminococcus sp.]